MRKNKKRQEINHKGRSKDMTCKLLFTGSEVFPEKARCGIDVGKEAADSLIQ